MIALLSRVSAFVGRYLPSRLADVLRIIGATVLQKPFRQGCWELLASSVSALLRSDHSLGMPVHVTIEPTNFCSLGCPVCETGAGELGREGRRMLADEFAILLSRLGPDVNTLFLYWMGEPFMNPQVYNMGRLARVKGIWVETCTNGEQIEPDRLDGFNAVSFQIGGMTQETHEKYRVAGNLQKTMGNLVDADIAGETKVTVGFIVMRHNEHEIEPFLEMCRSMDVKGDVISPCVRTVEQANLYLPLDGRYWLYDEQALEEGRLVPKVRPHNSCPWIYYSTVIAADGMVYPCCRDVHGEYPMGNLHDKHLADIWNGARYSQFRHQIAHDQASVGICRLCSGFGVPLLK